MARRNILQRLHNVFVGEDGGVGLFELAQILLVVDASRDALTLLLQELGAYARALWSRNPVTLPPHPFSPGVVEGATPAVRGREHH